MSILLRSNLPDLVMADALPYLEFICEDEFQSFEPRYEKIFNVKEMRSGIAQSTQVSSLQAAGAVGEAEAVPLQKIYQGFSKTYTAIKYGIMLASSQETLDDLEYDVLAKNARKLMRSFMTTVEITSAAVLNNGFSDTGPDGKVLFATDHPLISAGAGTTSNRLAVDSDLSMSSLKSMITLLRAQVDTANNKIQLQPRQLIVPSSLEFTAHELLKSQMLVAADNASVNAVNSVNDRYKIEPVVWDYLTDDDQWQLATDSSDHMLCFYWRQRPSISSDADFKTNVALTKLLGRFAVGYSDFRGIVGTPGA